MALDRIAWAAREVGKFAVYKSFTTFAAPGRTRRLSRAGCQRISVLCYHRVNDTFRDNVTLPCETFESQMVFINRHYQLASIGDILTGQVDRSSSRPIVAVTFDDGYLDNYENAVPILKKQKVPAAFFVSTGFISTDRGFAHDLEKLGHALPAMTWDQLREMHAEGFELGSHTVNHVNLATVGDEEARRELVESKETLEQELGLASVPFAYCFGRRTDITAARRDLVRALDYSGCFSAYGGTNEGVLDLFDVKRFGINFRLQSAAFQAWIEGWSTAPAP